MRRREKQITDRGLIESIIMKSSVCRLGLSEDDRPYIVPLCFGYSDNTLYFHAAQEGKKVEIVKKNSTVCFEFDTDHEVVRSEKACKWDMRYRSVIGVGRASLIDDRKSKRRAFDIIMKHYSGGDAGYSDAGIRNALIIKVEIESMTGKQSGY